MSAEPIRVTNSELWPQWEGQVVNGTFPLRRFVGGSIHSGVFLTEHKAQNVSDAAIKFVPANSVLAEAQLVQWGAAAMLSHPHLVRIFDAGRYRSGGREFIFVVMEYAEQTLAQIVPRRALTPDEVKELLLPTLDTLAFLHRNQLAHGRLKPSNFLAIKDQLKLSSDCVRAIKHSASGIARTSAYDPPELKDRGIDAAGDIWSLGMTLMEALTQRTTAWPDETVSLPTDLPAPFANAVRGCLSVAPAVRPTALDLEAQFKPAPQAQPISAAQPPESPTPPEATAPPQRFGLRHLLLPAFVIAVPISVTAVMDLFDQSPDPWQSTAISARAPAAPSPNAQTKEPTGAGAASSSKNLPSSSTASSSVLHQVTPEVPRATREKIKGRVHVTVRVLVDPSGNVIGTLIENPGPSKYFAGLAEKAAGEWKFVPADKRRARVWMLLFVFNRNGVTARATAQ